MGLTAFIYKHRGDEQSNDGLSSRVERVTVVNIDGPFDPTEDAPAVMLVPGNLRGTVKVVGAVEEHGDWIEDYSLVSVGPMFGGTYVATSDSRFAEAIRAITGNYENIAPLHDRWETPAQYAAMCD